MGGLPAGVAEGAAPGLPGGRAGTEPGGVLPAGEHRRAAGEGAAVAAAGGDCRDGDPGERGEVPDGRGGEAGGGGDCAEGENPDDPAARQALPEALTVRAETKNRLRRDFSHQKREADEPETDLGGDEGAEQKSRGPARQGLPPQPPAPVCADVLPGDAGRGQTGGRPRAFEPDDDADLPDFDRRRAPEGAGKAETDQLDGRNILS